MGVRAFLLRDRVNLLGVVLALGLIGAGAAALALEQGVATVFLLLAGFTVLMFLEYRRVQQAE